ncbi:MAG: F0F1 ATP synthase subunit A [Ignavibacteriales bacterium]|nr:MAG: F0F1 ATP synthase subunit A [Ignavibacteriales bacterium]
MFSGNLSDTLAVADTLKHSGGNDSGWILHHIMDGRTLDFLPIGEIHIPQLPLVFGIDITPTKHVIFMWLAALLVLVIFSIVAGKYKKSLVPKGIANFFEILVVFVRDEIARPTIGHHYNKFLPYLLTVFFFILFGNFLGLIPFSATFTSNIAVTASLAIITFVVTQFGGMKSNGVFGYLKGLVPHGIPSWMLIIMIPVEILGLFTKPFALAIRLFANMIAGHTVILALIGLIFFMQTVFVAPVSIGFALFIYLLEILVALIQAYIFTMLSSLFIGMAVHQEH